MDRQYNIEITQNTTLIIIYNLTASYKFKYVNHFKYQIF